MSILAYIVDVLVAKLLYNLIQILVLRLHCNFCPAILLCVFVSLLINLFFVNPCAPRTQIFVVYCILASGVECYILYTICSFRLSRNSKKRFCLSVSASSCLPYPCAVPNPLALTFLVLTPASNLAFSAM